MFNFHLTIIDIVILILNILACSRAVYWNVIAAQTGVLTKTRVVVATLGCFYVLAYFYLAFIDIEPGIWSNFMRGLGPLAFSYAWADPAKASVEAQPKLIEQLERSVFQRIGIEDKKDGDE